MGEKETSEIFRRLGTIETTLARVLAMLESGQSQREEFKKQLADHEMRIRRLEASRAWLMGIMAALTFASNIVGILLGLKFGGAS